MEYTTKVLLPTDDNIQYVAKLLNDGEVCGIPTETVYGLAANAYDENAVEKIFIAKGRPQDNPLIVHINSLDMLTQLVSYVPPLAYRLAEKFWPGPLTMIFQKSDNVPLAVTAGLHTVAVRYPSNKVVQKLILTAGMPLAAPSANISGNPSPTSANHVFNDLNGKIPAILDGGSCDVGLESTVVLLNEDGITLLRPGAVTVEMLLEIEPNVIIDKGVLNQIDDDEAVSSPGMKHLHYSPKTKMYIVDSQLDDFVNFVNKQGGASSNLSIGASSKPNIGAMVFDGEQDKITVPCVTFGEQGDSIIQAKLLFSALRAIDDLNVDIVYARMPSKSGIGLGVYNRLIRACGFEIISI